MALTTGLLTRRPKKNIAAAPSAGSRGIIQMCSKKNIACLSFRKAGSLFSVPRSPLVLRYSFLVLRKTLNLVPRTSHHLPLQQVHFVHVHRLLVAEEGDQNAQSDGGLCGGVGHDEDGENLSLQVVKAGKGDKVQVHRIQNQLD